MLHSTAPYMTEEPRRIFYFCYRHNEPRGGQKHTYRHVDILNRNGWDAWAFHPGEEFRLTWFRNTTRVVGEREFGTLFRPGIDVLVLPEDLGPAIVNFPGPKVIFNKNVFSGLQAFGPPGGAFFDPYRASDLLAAFTVSTHNQRILQYTYPELPIHAVPVEIDPGIFRFRQLADKAPLVALSPKMPELVLPLYQLLRARGEQGLNRAREFDWVLLREMPEHELTSVLEQALVFITFSVAEGVGRLPLEAMASGCLLLTPRLGPLAPSVAADQDWQPGDLLGAARWLEAVMDAWPNNLAVWSSLVEAGRAAAAEFSLPNQERSVMEAWRRVLAGL